MSDESWDRRKADQQARQELSRAINQLERRVDQRLKNMETQVRELDSFLRGGPHNEDPLGTRVHLLEVGLRELQILVKGEGAFGKGGLKELAKQASSDATEALRVAQGKSGERVSRREHWVRLLLGILSAIGLVVAAAFTNWDKVYNTIRRESPDEKLERIKREIEEEKKTRGPAVKKKLRDIERAARYR